MKRLNRTFVFLMALVMLVSSLSGAAMAVESKTALSKLTPISDKSGTYTFINPYYADIVTEDMIPEPIELDLTDQRVMAAMATTPSTSLEDAGTQLRQQMIKRTNPAVVTLSRNTGYFSTISVGDCFDQVLAEALKETSNPSEGDYIAHNFTSYNGRYSSSSSRIVLTYNISYNTDVQQEQYVDRRVGQILDDLELTGKPNDYKIAKIYDYITQNVAYDYDLSDDNVKHSAYAALANGKAVCSGYALLFYRMIREAGLSSRIISGIGNSGSHAWTIEQLADLPEGTYALYDIRDSISYSYGTIPGCENASDIVWMAEQKLLPADRKIVLFCMHGTQSVDLCEKLCELGFDAYSLKGGYASWLRKQLTKADRSAEIEESLSSQL